MKMGTVCSVETSVDIQYTTRLKVADSIHLHTDHRVTPTQYPGVYLGHPVPGGYKYGNLSIQVGGVSNETVKYGREFCGTSTQE
jgi:hypothetical protein